jgi:hypothetical protein
MVHCLTAQGDREELALHERSPFVYTPLPPGCIRLLIPDTAGNPDGKSWNLWTVYLDELNLEYHALSYVWGSQEETYPIRCNNQSLDVHNNLYSALPHLARRPQNDTIRSI